MKIINLGILAHVDAGKTSLTERLLFNNGVIDHVGSVDDGNTQTDSLALERQRGITIKSAVVSFVSTNTTINLIDTPGHSDFIAEVERVLSVLDGAVLVISAVEGVQPQTRVLMRALQRLRIPTIIFVNKLDRLGADYDRVFQEITQKLTPNVLSMGQAHSLGTHDADFAPYGADNADFTGDLADVLSRHNDDILTAYIDQSALPYHKLMWILKTQTKRAQVYPVFAGSAITGTGVEAVNAAITELLPSAGSNVCGLVSGTVFKVERGASGEKTAYVRLFSGTILTREEIEFGKGNKGKVTAISVFNDGSTVARPRLVAGEIGKLWGLNKIQIGDPVGAKSAVTPQHHFAPPTLETVVVAAQATDKGRLHAALDQLAEQDPLINLRQDDIRGELYLSLYGEVQKEVVQATLANDYGLRAEFRATTPICVERVISTGTSLAIGKRGDPFLATVGLKVEPAAPDTGPQYRLSTEVRGTMPAAFFKAVEDTVYETLRQGLHGWQVTDCIVTLTHTGYFPRQSHAHARFDKSMSSTGADFRGLVPLVLMDALKYAGTVVCEPLHHFALEMPAGLLGTVLPALTKSRAIPQTTVIRGLLCILEGEIPAARVHELQQKLPSLTRGEGALEVVFDHYEPVSGEIPTRPRTDNNPLNQVEYLRKLAQRG